MPTEDDQTAVRPGLRDRTRAARRAAMVEAAMTLFEQQGYDNVTVADICDKASVSPRTFFRYFATKDDLLAEPTREMYHQIVDAIDTAPTGLGDEATMTHALLSLGDYVIDHQERLLTFVRVTAVTEAGRRQAFGRFFTIERELADRISTKNGSRPAGEPDWQLRLIVGRALVAYRVWLDDLLRLDLPNPHEHLIAILTA
ncbi:MAG: helix-turn-helix domain-containing protein [Gordonia sp. (in: high G+C Gram-positive bacteria)]